MDCFALSAFEDNTELVLETGYIYMIANALEWRMEELYWVWEQAVGRFTLVVLPRSPDGFSLFGVVVCVFVWLVLCGCVFCVFFLFVLWCCVVDPPPVRRSAFLDLRNPILCLISSDFAAQSLVSTLLLLCCGYGVASYADLRHFSHGLPVSCRSAAATAQKKTSVFVAIYEHVLWNNILCHATLLKKCETFSCAIFQKFDTKELNRAVGNIHSRVHVQHSRVLWLLSSVWILYSCAFPFKGGRLGLRLRLTVVLSHTTTHTTRRFGEPTFRPSRTAIGKTQWRRAHVSSFFYLFSFDSVSFSLLVFCSLLSSLHIVGSLTCKLPFIRIFCTWFLLKFCDHFFSFDWWLTMFFKNSFAISGFVFACWISFQSRLDSRDSRILWFAITSYVAHLDR